MTLLLFLSSLFSSLILFLFSPPLSSSFFPSHILNYFPSTLLISCSASSPLLLSPSISFFRHPSSPLLHFPTHFSSLSFCHLNSAFIPFSVFLLLSPLRLSPLLLNFLTLCFTLFSPLCCRSFLLLPLLSLM